MECIKEWKNEVFNALKNVTLFAKTSESSLLSFKSN